MRRLVTTKLHIYDCVVSLYIANHLLYVNSAKLYLKTIFSYKTIAFFVMEVHTYYIKRTRPMLKHVYSFVLFSTGLRYSISLGHVFFQIQMAAFFRTAILFDWNVIFV